MSEDLDRLPDPHELSEMLTKADWDRFFQCGGGARFHDGGSCSLAMVYLIKQRDKARALAKECLDALDEIDPADIPAFRNLAFDENPWLEG